MGVAPGDDKDGIERVGGKGFEGTDYAVGWSGTFGVGDDGGEGAVVVKHEEAAFCGRIGGEEAAGIEDGGYGVKFRSLQFTEELGKEAGVPGGGGVGGDIFPELLEVGVTFLGSEF